MTEEQHQTLVDKMLKMYTEDRIADPESMPGLFAYQVRLAQYQLQVETETVPVVV